MRETADKIAAGLERLDKMQFFMGQRAGRELWMAKPHDVQESDLEQYNRDVETVRSLIQQLAAKVPCWISVKERLPERYVNVLAITRYSEDTWDVEIVYLSLGGWQKPEVMLRSKVTHWMPLPEQQKEVPHEENPDAL